MPDAPTADPQAAVEQMRAATERLRDQAWKVIDIPSNDQTAPPSAGG